MGPWVTRVMRFAAIAFHERAQERYDLLASCAVLAHYNGVIPQSVGARMVSLTVSLKVSFEAAICLPGCDRHWDVKRRPISPGTGTRTRCPVCRCLSPLTPKRCRLLGAVMKEVPYSEDGVIELHGSSVYSVGPRIPPDFFSVAMCWDMNSSRAGGRGKRFCVPIVTAINRYGVVRLKSTLGLSNGEACWEKLKQVIQ